MRTFRTILLLAGIAFGLTAAFGHSRHGGFHQHCHHNHDASAPKTEAAPK